VIDGRKRDQVTVRFTELNIFGVYVAPFAPMMLAAWVVTLVLQRLGNRFGLVRYIWHPALFTIAVYVIVLSAIVIAVGWL
jgi:protein AaeX